MNNDKDIVLSSDTLLNWDFKLDARGYRPQEVDKVLDIVINDYKIFNRKEKEYQEKIDELNKQILDLKHQLRNANENMQIFKASEKEITNLDLIKRVSQLEKIIYGKEE
ncbi:MAG: DivIVA domain-containing protein [Bacilli bacterium]|nr:DivIVA domain-containing protein [Bacilli bacterium]